MVSYRGRNGGTADPAGVWKEFETSNVVQIAKAGKPRAGAPAQVEAAPSKYNRPEGVSEDVWKLAEHWIVLGTQTIGVHPRANWENFSKRLQDAISMEPRLNKIRQRKGEAYYLECLTWMVDRFWGWIGSLAEGDTLRTPGPNLQSLFFIDNWPGLVDGSSVAINTRRIMSSLRIQERYPDLTEEQLLERFPGRFYGLQKVSDTWKYLDRIAEAATLREAENRTRAQQAEESFFGSLGEPVPDEATLLPEDAEPLPEDELDAARLRRATSIATFVAQRKKQGKRT